MAVRLRSVLMVLLLAPVTAEYLIGYDDITGNVAALLFGILFFAPLYGAPALLIRELARRRGLGWPGILLLATAFGLIEAGLIDQSLFDPAYRDIAYWDDLRKPTFLSPFGTSAFMVLTFVAGHVFGTIAAPIAMAESWRADGDREPWLGRPGLALAVLAWALGAGVILQDQLHSTSFRISASQLAGTLAVAAVLVGAALTRHPRPEPRTAPPPWVAGLVTAVLLTPRSLIPATWAWTVAAALAIAVWLLLAGRWSRATGWDGRHTVATLAGVLVSIGGPAFLITPLGDVPLAVKLISNVLLLALVLAIAVRGYVVQRALLDSASCNQPSAV